MIPRERTIRTGRATGVRIEPMLSTALLAELLFPGPGLWLVSPWISDVAVLDNSRGDYDSVVPEAAARMYRLSDMLSALAESGALVTVVIRPDAHNERFRNVLKRRTARPIRVVEDPDVHEKTLCGDTWLLTGSMNFTLRGMQVNDEAMSYQLNPTAAAQARLEFSRRWGQP